MNFNKDPAIATLSILISYVPISSQPAMNQRSTFEAVSRKWICLWCAPVDWKLFDQLHNDAFEDCSSNGRLPTKQGFAEGLREFVAVFPDLQTKVESLVIDEFNSTVAIRWTAQGTNQGRFLGVGPTHRLTSIYGIEIIEIQHGQIIRRWGEWDISSHLMCDSYKPLQC